MARMPTLRLRHTLLKSRSIVIYDTDPVKATWSKRQHLRLFLTQEYEFTLKII